MIVLNDMSIYLTEECNFSCKYCYYKKDYSTTLDFKTIKKWLNFFYTDIIRDTKQCSITILGGEPLLKVDLLLKTIDCINDLSEKAGKHTKTMVFTNGALLDRQVAGTLLKKNAGIYLSLDGIKESNDLYRVSRCSKSAFDEVKVKINALPEDYLQQMNVNMVIGPKNCQYLMDNIRFLSSKGFKGIDISLMSYLPWSKDALKTLIDQLDIFFHYYISLFNDKKAHRFRMYQLQDLFHGSWNKMDNCNRIKLGSDGNLYFCDAFFSVESKKRKQFSLEKWDKNTLEQEIERIKSEARSGISSVYPKMYNLHKLNKMVYCPYGVYYYSKVHNNDLKKALKNYYQFSRIYSSFLFYLYQKLKYNQEFIEFYRN